MLTAPKYLHFRDNCLGEEVEENGRLSFVLFFFNWGLKEINHFTSLKMKLALTGKT